MLDIEFWVGYLWVWLLFAGFGCWGFWVIVLLYSGRLIMLVCDCCLLCFIDVVC